MKKPNILVLAAIVSITIAVVFASLIAASPIDSGGRSQPASMMSVPF